MKKILLLLGVFVSVITANAQLTPNDISTAKQVVTKNKTAIGLTDADLTNIIVSSTYTSAEGIRMVYLYQSYKDISVYNQMQVLAFKNDKLVSAAGSRIPLLEQKVNTASGIPSISMQDAIRAALTESKIDLQRITGSMNAPATNAWGKADFGKLGVSDENITAELMWVPTEEKQVKLAWQIFLVPVNSSDMWMIRVDAQNGSVIEKNNLTVYDNWHLDEQAPVINKNTGAENTTAKEATAIPKFELGKEKTPVVNSATYRVVKYPAESPNHPGGAPSLHTDPWTMAGGNATTLKWHNDGTQDHDSTRGNNVWAAEDRNNTDGIIDKAAVSQTPQPNLTFDYVPNFSQSPVLTTPPNQQFNITNLFYMNNIMHDISYIYGFDEVAGNFQNSNLGRGGLGNDYVIGDAQDGLATNNANFGTPPDGQKPRMQMFLWNGSPSLDGDADNGVIAHEFGHGISNRLTGGPANTSCLGNAEQAGEGWSDFYALMTCTNWATATVNDGPLPRTIGTYVLGQPVNGPGIRNFPYSTNLSICPLIYSAVLPGAGQQHARGTYWCAALWEMTWEMIQVTGINPNLFNASGVGGNAAAIKLVTEGMKLQPCNPGFIDARDAILKADTLFFGAQYSCAIWKAFAKRGMGRNASQGSSNSVTDQVPSFIVDNGVFSITQSAPQQSEGQNHTYTNHVTAGACSPMTNFFITDTLPTNVTYVSGGSYNAGNRTITFGPINLTSGQSQTHPFTVTVNNGTYFAPVTLLNETVPTTTLPAAWTANPAGGGWTTSTVFSHSAPNSFFVPDPVVLVDHRLSSTAYTLNPGTVSNYALLSFWHRFNTEDGWDGGVVEISTNGGATWTDLGSKMISGKYNGSLGGGSGNVLAGRSAFTGFVNSFIKTEINLSSYAGQAVNIRFRFASDDNTAPPGGGWFVDDIVISSEPAVYIKSNLFNSLSQLASVADTLTKINVGCVVAGITTPPANVNSCAGANASFTIVAAGTPINYQWQVNTGSGFADVPNAPPYTGGTTATLTITGVTAGMNGYQYRCIISNTCTAALTSGAATLAVGTNAVVNTHPAGSTICDAANTSFTVAATGATSYQWQVNTGSGFADVPAAPPYSGTTTATLTITAATAAMTGYQYRCVLGSCGTPVNSNAATLTISVPVTITTHPATVSLCHGAAHTLSVTTTGTVSSYQWQLSTDGGNTYNNISGATTASLPLTAAVAQTGYRFRCIVTGSCGPVISNAAILTVNPQPDFNLNGIPGIVCQSDAIVKLAASVPGGTWSGTGVQGNQFTPSVAGVGSRTITYTLTVAGCTTVKTALVQVNECAERHLLLNAFTAVYVYPNPNNGQFSIRLNTDLYHSLGLKIYTSDGKLVKTQAVTGVGYGSVIPVDLTGVPSGNYQLYIYNEEGAFIKKGVSIIVYRK